MMFDDDKTTPMRQVTLTGSQEACDNAAKYIINFVEVGRQRRLAAGSV
jgi:hypothetical protein